LPHSVFFAAPETFKAQKKKKKKLAV